MTDSATPCLLCSRRQPHPPMLTCLPCRGRTAECLQDIVEAYALLPLFKSAGGGSDTSGIRRKGPKFTTPLNLGAVDAEDQVLAVVDGWAQILREERDLSQPDKTTVVEACNLLSAHLDWVCAQPWVDDMWSELKDARRELRRVQGEPRPKPLGMCPVLIGEGEDMQECGTPIFPPSRGDSLVCYGCKASWSGTEVIRLQMMMEAS